MGRLGLVLYHGIESGPELKQYGQIAEDAGYESLWVTERYFHEEIFSILVLLQKGSNSVLASLTPTRGIPRS